MIQNRVYTLTTTVISAAILVVQMPLATALQTAEINTIAQKITVRIEGNTKEFGKVYGSGVIIKKQGNTYTVLTNWHVVQVIGNYNLYTNDKQKYVITSKQKLGELDLAIVEFNSSRNYLPATIGNSRQLTETTTVYAAGFAAPDAICLEACYRFVEGKIDAVLSKYKEGYGLIYSNNIAQGMSGGPVLNQDGLLVGINGRASTTQEGIVSYAAIPIHEYQKYDNVASIPKPAPKPAPKPTTKPIENSDTTPISKPLPGDLCGSNIVTQGIFNNVSHDGSYYKVWNDFRRGKEPGFSNACGRQYWVKEAPNHYNYGVRFVYLIDGKGVCVVPYLFIEATNGSLAIAREAPECFSGNNNNFINTNKSINDNTTIFKNWILEFSRYQQVGNRCWISNQETITVTQSGSNLTGKIPWSTNGSGGYAIVTGKIESGKVTLRSEPPLRGYFAKIFEGNLTSGGEFTGKIIPQDACQGGSVGSFRLMPAR